MKIESELRPSVALSLECIFRRYVKMFCYCCLKVKSVIISFILIILSSNLLQLQILWLCCILLYVHFSIMYNEVLC